MSGKLFPEGTKVKISPNSEYRRQSGGTNGVVKQLTSDSSWPYIVRWDNGHLNHYKVSDILLAEGDEDIERINRRLPKEDVLVHLDQHNKFARRLANHDSDECPDVFLLGKNKHGVIVDSCEVEDSGDGCSQMPSLDTTSLTKGYVTLSKRKLIPCGLIRIGAGINDSDSDRGDSLYQVGSMGGFVITMSPTRVVVEHSQGEECNVRSLNYTIVAHKTKRK